MGKENAVEPALVPSTAVVHVALARVGIPDAQGPGDHAGFVVAAEGAVGKVMVVLIALGELDAKIGKDAVTEDVDFVVVGNESHESVELEGVICSLTSRVVWADIESAGIFGIGSVRKLSEDLRLRILDRSNWNTIPPS